MDVRLIVVNKAHRLLIHSNTIALRTLGDSVMLYVVYILNT